MLDYPLGKLYTPRVMGVSTNADIPTRGAGSTGLQANASLAKKRYEWIDNSRSIAAFLILVNHLLAMSHFGGTYGSEYLRLLVWGIPYSGYVPFFLLLAGYFLARNITWGKAWNRFVWLLIPFAAWNCLFAFGCLGRPLTIETLGVDIMGINKVFLFDVRLFKEMADCTPAIGPSWFLRDILFLSLLTPMIAKFGKWIPVLLLAMASLALLNSAPHSNYFLSPQAVFFYALGVWLSRYKIEEVNHLLNPAFTKYFVGGTLISACSVTYLYLHPLPTGILGAGTSMDFLMFHGFFYTLVGMLFGTLMIAYTGVLIEKHLPGLSKRLAPLGPACFLVFMLHWPILVILKSHVPAELWNSWWILCLPIPLFAVICLLFLGMKKYTPFLMPYLGHMKLPKKASTK